MSLNKSKNSILALLVVLLVGTVPNGCRKELLDSLPENQLASAESFSTPDRFLSLLNGIYSLVKSGNFLGSRYLIYGDVRAEEFLNETGNGVTGLQTWNHTLVESNNEVNNVWNAGYRAINEINIYLDGAQANSANLRNDALLANYLGEARFLRALCYHNLVTLYCRPYADGNGSNLGLPLRLKAELLAQDNDLARSTVAEVYAQILDDLNFAEANLPATQTGANAVTRAHKNAAIALKARVYLGMQRYADAITEANKIVPAAAPYKAATGMPHELQASVKNVFTTYTTAESIFSMPFTTNNLPGTQNALGYYYNPSPRGNGEFSMNRAGIIGDTATFSVIDDRRQFVLIHTNSKPYLNKYPTGPQSTDYAPVLRYAEVLLTLAEAEARVNGVNARAVDLLNAVRTRSKGTAYTAADFADGAALAAAILKERRIELMGEGLRSFDLMRLLLPIPGKGNVGEVTPDNSDYIWPMPSGELAVNKLCQRNP